MTQTPQEVYQSMNLSKILIAILESEKEIKVPLDVFLNANNEERNLNVEYNNEESVFVFKLKDNNEQQNTDENAE